MTCKDCNKSKAKYIMPCKVCILLDEDFQAKNAIYCKPCSNYICIPCSTNWIRRAKAFINTL